MHDFDDLYDYPWLQTGIVLFFFVYVLLLVAKVCHVELATGSVQQLIDSFLLITSCLLLFSCLAVFTYILLCEIAWGIGNLSTTLLFLASLFVLVAKLPVPMIQHKLLLPWGCSMSVLGYLVTGFILTRIFFFGYRFIIKKASWLKRDEFAIVLICLIRPLCFFCLYVCAYHAWAGLAPSPACLVWSYLLFFLYLCLEGVLCLVSFFNF